MQQSLVRLTSLQEETSYTSSTLDHTELTCHSQLSPSRLGYTEPRRPRNDILEPGNFSMLRSLWPRWTTGPEEADKIRHGMTKMTTSQHKCLMNKLSIASETAHKPSQSTIHEESSNGESDQATGAGPLRSALHPARKKTDQPASTPLGPSVVGLPHRVLVHRISCGIPATGQRQAPRWLHAMRQGRGGSLGGDSQTSTTVREGPLLDSCGTAPACRRSVKRIE